jgi:GDPmannose 4,6-dehydratase
VRDAVRAYYMLVTVNPTAGAYYNIGGTHSCTVKEILDTLISFSPAKDAIKVEVDPDRLRPIDADLQVPNTAKFHAHTGWKPEIPHEKTLRDLLDYWRTRVATEGDRFLTR